MYGRNDPEDDLVQINSWFFQGTLNFYPLLLRLLL